MNLKPAPPIGTRISGIYGSTPGTVADTTGIVIERDGDHFLVEYHDGKQAAYSSRDEGSYWSNLTRAVNYARTWLDRHGGEYLSDQAVTHMLGHRPTYWDLHYARCILQLGAERRNRILHQ